MYPSIKLNHIEKKMEQWGEHKRRVYSYCTVCKRLLSEKQQCLNNSCERFMMCQANVSGNKTIVTFSLRCQLEKLIENGIFGKEVMVQGDESLCSRLKDTPKYKSKIEEMKLARPDAITLLVSVNCDGFRRRGSKRGEFWPIYLAVHEITQGTGKFVEYRPEFVMLPALLQSSTKLDKGDFSSVFERIFIEIDEIRKNPLKVTISGQEYDVVVEIFQSVLDMDASRKIHGVPNWKSFKSCSRCTVNGTSIKLKKGRKIAWFSENMVVQYDANNIPEKLIKTRLPPPWTDGYDGLHLLYEGTSRDVLKDLMGRGEKTGYSINNNIRREWAVQ
ncbi:hypothetical protein B9Z55_008479 [Caenorhabditis nigoni]|uniref:Uncharacterized protein n=1 Tax=Caenorhabditis nigoni TaxID=1611254 RepID=A0A2G5UMX6_9PELO|nr:hypothetical protein B9Z55_008479 [Caenorhabditis nigoni]